MAYTNIEYADIVFMLGLADGNGNLAARLWAERFPQRRVPRPNTFLTTYRHLRETGNVRPVNEVGRPRFVRNVTNEELVLDLVHEDPELSVRRIALRTGISPSVVWRILHQNHMHPYHRQRVQELLPRDYPARLIFSQTIIGKTAMNPNFLKNILFTDEASEENPHAIRIMGSQYKFSINIWCGLMGNTLLGSHELPARLNGQGFLYFIMHYLPILLENVPLEEQETMWFMLDGAPPHHTNAVRQQLHYLFPDKIIGREAGNNAQYQQVYAKEVNNRNELLMRINNVADIIRQTPNLLNKTWGSLHRRMEKCIEVNGGHIGQLL
ncbi:hypothetical protein QTP88_027767 [Uroleucon formosanum]